MSTGSQTKNRQKTIPLELIRPAKTALRKVDTKKVEYTELVDSIRDRGVLQPISVRESTDSESGEKFFSLIDGLHRYSAAKDAGLSDIPCHILAMSDAEVLEAQIIANVQKIETKPVEYAKQMVKILGHNPTWTLADMAAKLNKSTTWVSKRMSLVDLPEKVAKLVDEGKIKLANAYDLVDLNKLAPNEVENYLDRAQTQQPIEFGPAVSGRVKEIRANRLKGKKEEKSEEFTPYPFPKKTGTLKDEYEKPRIASKIIEATGAKTPEEGFNSAIKWVFNMDPISIEENRQKWQQEKEVAAAEKERRAAERAKKRQEEAAKATADAVEVEA